MSLHARTNNYDLGRTLHFQKVLNERFFVQYISNSIHLLIFVFSSLLFMILSVISFYLFIFLWPRGQIFKSRRFLSYRVHCFSRYFYTISLPHFSEMHIHLKNTFIQDANILDLLRKVVVFNNKICWTKVMNWVLQLYR